MMTTYREAEEGQFFDARSEITSVSDLGSDCFEGCSNSGLINCASDELGYDFWTKNPESVHERRDRFLKWMGLSSDWNPIEREDSRDMPWDEIKVGMDRITENSGAVLRNAVLEEQFICSLSSASYQPKEATELVEDDASEQNFVSRITNLDDGIEFSTNEVSRDGTLSRLQESGSNRSVTVGECQRTLGSSSFAPHILQKEVGAANVADSKKKVKRGWLRKLGVLAHIMDRQGKASLKPSGYNREVGAKIQRVRVHSHRKRSKELSSLYAAQEFRAHEGSILTMKFSPDGKYLASAGEDGVVRIWNVIEDEGPNKFDIQDTDPSSSYFSVNHLSKLPPLDVDKEKIGKMKKLRKSSESACVIFPPKVFQLLEKPLHEFHGHSGKVLALSWSKKGFLLSSSVDKTVRLWQVGRDQCLRVFSHNNYVTCVEFNPLDDNYFISGSIDGKVRIWEVRRCQVVDWTDIREIVTAVCYFPNGKGGIVGSMDGLCRFYDIIDKRLQLDAQIYLQGKKKLSGKSITGFQFSPSDPSKVMVTSADSQVRILCGVNVIFKFKGIRNSGSQVPASFTSDGKHIICASEDSNVYIWNYISQERTSSRSKTISSYESFLSSNISIALPWGGMETISELPTTPTSVGDDLLGSILRKGKCGEDSTHRMPISSPDCFHLSRGFFSESLLKGSATWPEEKLTESSPVPVSPIMCKSEYKLLKSAFQNTSGSPHMWGQVIVAASWDGRIRTYYNYGLPIRH
ncbi:uncharacterized protein LOC132308176 [Cornus florida]|uniref:uncharacterized protein LOC132308176 n=1 Tax=Cornus florida TaxID=4283 RepID=UPI00289A7B6B|nr:uncharacterized protein LOC132308176 [Cornus florida]